MDERDRRVSTRRPASENRARLEWAGGVDFLNSPARLLDISEGGASFVAVLSPPANAPVWLRLEAPKAMGWILARVVRHDGPTTGALSFSGQCPRELVDRLS